MKAGKQAFGSTDYSCCSHSPQLTSYYKQSRACRSRHTLPRLTFLYCHIHLDTSENSATEDAKTLIRNKHQQLHLRPLEKRFGSFRKAFGLFYRFAIPKKIRNSPRVREAELLYSWSAHHSQIHIKIVQMLI